MAEQVWTRREGESSVAYDAFKEYLRQGKGRSLRSVAEALSKSEALMKRWSSAYDWPARSVAYDSYVFTAATDGDVSLIAESRDKNLALMDKLRGLLDSRLDDFIAKRDDPTIRWTQACMAMAKIEANSLLMGKDSDKTSEQVTRVERMLEELDERMQGRSA